MALKFDNTCIIIDSNRSSFIYDIEFLLREMIKAYYLPLNEEERGFLIRYTREIYEIFENRFDIVRSTNVDIRAAANKQLDKLENEKRELENQIEELRNELTKWKNRCKI